jgi:acetoin utilization deacetylase AcuC-like enzyme
MGNYMRLFNPDHIIVSAGFDGYHKDHILGLKYSLGGYYLVGKFLASLGKPISAVLEGGYHARVGACIQAFDAGVSGRIYEAGEDLTTSPKPCLNALSSSLRTLRKLLT